MKMVEPSGAKIIDLRTRAGKKQAELASELGVSERLLRDIERKDRPVREQTLARLAAILNTRVSDLLKSPSRPPPEGERRGDRLIMAVARVTSGGMLLRRAAAAFGMTWEMRVDPTPENAPLFEGVLKMVKHQAEFAGGFGDDAKDEFDEAYEFPEIYRTARINDLLRKLDDEGIAVGFVEYPGSYYNEYGEGYKPGRLIHVVFDLTSDEIRPAAINLSTHEWRLKNRPAKTPDFDLDDEIPF